MFDEDVEGFDPFRSSSMGQVIAGTLGADNPFNRPRGRRPADPVDVAVAEVLAQRDAEAEATRVQAEVERKLAQLDALGADQLPERAVVAFTKRFSKGGHLFSYAAIRINDHWYLTGPANGLKMTNTEFCTWLLSGQGFEDWEVLRGGPEVTPTMHDVVPASYHDDDEPFI